MRNFKQDAYSDKASLFFFHRAVQEVHCDQAALHEIIRAWKGRDSTKKVEHLKNEAKANQTEIQELIARPTKPISSILDAGPSNFIRWADDQISRTVSQTFGNFVNIHEPILTEENIVDLVNGFREMAPEMFSQIHKLLGYDQKAKRNRNKQYAFAYRKAVLYSFIMDCRMADNKLWKSFALLNAAAQFCRGETSTAKQMSVYFHLSVSYGTLRTFLKGNHSLYRTNTRNALERLTGYRLAVIDNLQLGRNIKFQTAGSSNHFTKVTARIFVLPEKTAFPQRFNW